MNTETLHTKTNKPLVPQLRFTEFHGNWQNDEFDELVERYKAKYNPALNKENFPCIELDCLDQETGMLLKTIDSLGQKSIKNRFKKGQVLFGKLRPYLKKFYLTQFDGVCSSEIWVLNGINVSNDYLYHLIQTEKFNFEVNITSGSKMPRAEWEYISNIKFKYPTLPEQQKIAGFLTAVDTKIQQLTQKKELLQQYKKGVMQQLFPSAGSGQAPKLRFKIKNEVPELVEGPDWEEKKLGEVCQLITKGTTPTSIGFSFLTEGINFIKAENLSKSNSIDIHSTPKISEECNLKMFRSQIKENDILYSIAGTLGRSAIVKQKDIPANTNQALSIIRLNKNVDTKYVNYFLNSRSIEKRINQILSVGAQPNLSLKQVGNFKIKFPVFEEQQKIASYLSALDNKIESVAQQITQTQKFKKGLLQQLFV